VAVAPKAAGNLSMKKVAYFAKEASFLLLYGKKYIFFIKDVV